MGLDGRPKKDTPLVHEDTVVLKLKPGRKEPLVCYRETAKSIYTKDTEKEMGKEMTPKRYEAIVYLQIRMWSFLPDFPKNSLRFQLEIPTRK